MSDGTAAISLRTSANTVHLAIVRIHVARVRVHLARVRVHLGAGARPPSELDVLFDAGRVHLSEGSPLLGDKCHPPGRSTRQPRGGIRPPRTERRRRQRGTRLPRRGSDALERDPPTRPSNATLNGRRSIATHDVHRRFAVPNYRASAPTSPPSAHGLAWTCKSRAALTARISIAEAVPPAPAPPSWMSGVCR